MTSVKNRRNYLVLSFLFNLVNNKIDYSYLLEKLNFKINSSNTRDTKILFFYKTFIQIIQFFISILMSVGDSANLDISSCSINDIENLRN